MKLKFKNPKFYPGRNVTIRRGTKWDKCPCKDNVLIECEGEGAYDSRHTKIRTKVMMFKDLTICDLLCEHDEECRDYFGLLDRMKEYYEDFNEYELITVVEFIL